MSTDIALVWNKDTQSCEINFDTEVNDTVMSKTLLGPVLISLFTDSRAANDDSLPDLSSTDRRGWWGDSTNTLKEGDSVGSRLWLLEREKSTDTALVKAKLYIEEALKWILDEGIAAKIEVVTEKQQVPRSGTLILAFQVKLYKPDGESGMFSFVLDNNKYYNTSYGFSGIVDGGTALGGGSIIDGGVA